ncbi:eukaryotic translation initiation factor 4E [Basidiobolus meristosporus CBS 931.73]|uniref:Eukaryotic translation initiation factor 4E n=1 Tax=Basidiobolus meristosporus CBS 931.73 TaxID=1314790 RepID=A0A1Y1X8Q8_9FUNG|nr:eukaryotic translation initiation factor 4E [Basidiobolus meristosporus CBS 931.73]|eukprot:ORX81806.1 eukaryotic translation initiation factor 4E [Basidiobolus meristosporus CBS 931.73]
MSLPELSKLSLEQTSESHPVSEPDPHGGDQPQSRADPSPQEEDDMVTVFTDPANFNVKHPLNSSWILWYDNPGKKTNQHSWSQNLKQIICFDTVEDFWGIWNNLIPISDLSAGSNYHFFKEGIKPMWEDPANDKGGKWVIQLPRKTGEQINQLWLYTVLSCIGESFAYEDEICGCVASIRKGFYRLALWTRSSDDQEICLSIGTHLKETLSLGPNQSLGFQAHSDASRSGSFKKDRFVV